MVRLLEKEKRIRGFTKLLVESDRKIFFLQKVTTYNFFCTSICQRFEETKDNKRVKVVILTTCRDNPEN
ncbi:hypothetical protein FF38_06243 [Lucilia cuprina]|uniref:Uncharacterized protein n=1 Tax=Lucilia cuprina TaxID=7375 RepID=A0A0L0CBH2_LUCCU|nr:hypothetical protein FF38_06243 [Lucilia cuprina]